MGLEPDGPSPEGAAEKAVDPDRLLPGEDPTSSFPDDAQHWVEVYSELLAYKNRVLALTEEAVASMPGPAAAAEVARTDRAVIRAERDRFHRRLGYWTRRLAEMTAS
jgi:hypothetical protein